MNINVDGRHTLDGEGVSKKEDVFGEGAGELVTTIPNLLLHQV